MSKRKFEKDNDRKDFVRSNGQIRVPKVLLVHDDQKLGVMPTKVALAKARDAGLDLVEVAPNARPPVCSIMDYGKYMFDKQKRDKAKAKPQQNKEKEISMRYVISDNDLETKAGQARKFLEKDQRVKLIVKFKRREKAHKEEGFTAINKLIEKIGDVAIVDRKPGYEGNCITARISKKKS